jgi:hypothetical protein
MKGCVDKGVESGRVRKKISQQRSWKGSDLERLSDFLNTIKHKTRTFKNTRTCSEVIISFWETLFQGPQVIWFHGLREAEAI